MDLPSSPLCDRNATLVPESQVGKEREEEDDLELI